MIKFSFSKKFSERTTVGKFVYVGGVCGAISSILGLLWGGYAFASEQVRTVAKEEAKKEVEKLEESTQNLQRSTKGLYTQVLMLKSNTIDNSIRSLTQGRDRDELSAEEEAELETLLEQKRQTVRALQEATTPSQ